MNNTALWRTLALLGSLALAPAQAQTEEPANDIALDGPRSAGLGFAPRIEQSPYVGAGHHFDLLPLYLYEGSRLYLHATRVGIKLLDTPTHRVDALVDRRLEGFSASSAPSSLAGMATRTASVDWGLAYRHSQPWGKLKVELLGDANHSHSGAELRLGYSREWQHGPWTWRPSLSVGWRSAGLNNYYYGVRPGEASATRPAYAPGAEAQATLSLNLAYDLSAHWQLITGLSATRLGDKGTDSPIVQRRVLPAYYLGAVYDFGQPQRDRGAPDSPMHWKLLHGGATENGCHLIRIMTGQCLSTATVNPTRITAIQVGRPFIRNFNGWPLDVVGYVGVTHHDDRQLQPAGLQLDLFMKAYYSGFPWQPYIKTRLGWGMGASLAQRVPYIEASSQAASGEQTSRLLNYLEPTLDVSLGDLIGYRPLKDTYVGIGVSHRSGIFKSSRLLGNVNGGSNYLYGFVESVY